MNIRVSKEALNIDPSMKSKMKTRLNKLNLDTRLRTTLNMRSKCRRDLIRRAVTGHRSLFISKEVRHRM
jgi:hypothetical protein